MKARKMVASICAMLVCMNVAGSMMKVNASEENMGDEMPAFSYEEIIGVENFDDYTDEELNDYIHSVRMFAEASEKSGIALMADNDLIEQSWRAAAAVLANNDYVCTAKLITKSLDGEDLVENSNGRGQFAKK